MPEFISIVLPVYNGAQWLERCLDSVIDAADADCEIIVVDDGSTDRTPEILRHYEDADSRVLVVTTPHSGVGHARKTGVANAQGDSIVFVDCDDTMPPGAIADMRKVSAPDIDIVVGNASVLAGDGTRSLTLQGKPETIDGPEFANRLLCGTIDDRLPGKKIARRLFNVYYWDTNIHFAGIYYKALMLSLACATKAKVCIAPGVHSYVFRKRPSSLSSLLHLRAMGIDRLWLNVMRLPLPRQQLVKWGLKLLDDTLLCRGMPFSSHFTPAVDLRRMARGLDLTDDERRILHLLHSRKKRLKHAQRNLAEGFLTMEAPHLSIVVIADGSSDKVERTVRSILKTGFRNIEIILVPDGCPRNTCVTMNALSIRYRRVRYLSTPARTLNDNPMFRGLQTASGFAITFMNAGDEMVGEGVLDCLHHVDMGFDMSFVANAEVWHGITVNRYDPTKDALIHEGSGAPYDSLLGCGNFMPALNCYIANREFMLASGAMEVPSLRYDSRVLSMLRLLALNPRINASATCGIRWRLRSPGGTLDQHVDDRLVLALHILRDLQVQGRDTQGFRRRLGEGLISCITRLFADELAVPVLGKRRIHASMEHFFRNPAVTKFLEDTGMHAPAPAAIAARARALFRDNPLRGITRHLMR